MNLKKMGRKNSVVLGYFFMVSSILLKITFFCEKTIATAGFGTLNYIPHHPKAFCPDGTLNCDIKHRTVPNKDSPCATQDLFFGIAMVVRGFQGFANSFIGTSIYSMTTIEFPHNREKYIGYVELALGLGLMLGPVLGSFFMSLTNNDFEITFYIFGALIAAGGLFAFVALPNYLNKAELGVETTGLSARASIVSIGIHGVERREGEESDEEEDSMRGPTGKK